MTELEEALLDPTIGIPVEDGGVSAVFDAMEGCYEALLGDGDFRAFVDASAAAAAAADAATLGKHLEPAEIFRNVTGKRLPETKEEYDFADKVLSEEFDKLSMDDRDKVLFEIHGIATDDDPEDLDSYYSDLERYLSTIQEKEAYEAAKYFDPDYIKDIRIAFLRSERFDAKGAAEKMAKYFEVKKRLFGDGEILARDIRFSDLTEGDIEMMESGVLQVLPFRDAAGRAILLIRPELDLRFNDNKMRNMWYIFSTTLRDEVSLAA
jgi:hypothetical protein